MKQELFVIFFFLSIGLGLWTYENVEYEIHEQNLTLELQKKISPQYLDKKIQEAIASEQFDDVTMYMGLATMLHLPIPQSTLTMIENENSVSKKLIRKTKSFLTGFFSGSGTSTMELTGSIASDMTLYGDLRDVTIQGSKYKNGEPYDKFILQLSMVGIGLSATQLLSAGASTPLKVGASVMKVAKKSGKLTKSFSKILSKRLSKTVDMKVLKTITPKSILHLRKSTKVIAKSIDVTPVKGIFKELNGIKKYTSTADTISLLKYVDTTNDLRKIGKISKTYKANTKGVLKVLGKGALKSGARVMKYTSKLIGGIMGVLISLLGFFYLLFHGIVMVVSNTVVFLIRLFFRGFNYK